MNLLDKAFRFFRPEERTLDITDKKIPRDENNHPLLDKAQKSQVLGEVLNLYEKALASQQAATTESGQAAAIPGELVDLSRVKEVAVAIAGGEMVGKKSMLYLSTVTAKILFPETEGSFVGLTADQGKAALKIYEIIEK